MNIHIQLKSIIFVSLFAALYNMPLLAAGEQTSPNSIMANMSPIKRTMLRRRSSMYESGNLLSKICEAKDPQNIPQIIKGEVTSWISIFRKFIRQMEVKDTSGCFNEKVNIFAGQIVKKLAKRELLLKPNSIEKLKNALKPFAGYDRVNELTEQIVKFENEQNNATENLGYDSSASIEHNTDSASTQSKPAPSTQAAPAPSQQQAFKTTAKVNPQVSPKPVNSSSLIRPLESALGGGGRELLTSAPLRGEAICAPSSPSSPTGVWASISRESARPLPTNTRQSQNSKPPSGQSLTQVLTIPISAHEGPHSQPSPAIQSQAAAPTTTQASPPTPSSTQIPTSQSSTQLPAPAESRPALPIQILPTPPPVANLPMLPDIILKEPVLTPTAIPPFKITGQAGPSLPQTPSIITDDKKDQKTKSYYIKRLAGYSLLGAAAYFLGKEAFLYYREYKNRAIQ